MNEIIRYASFNGTPKKEVIYWNDDPSTVDNGSGFLATQLPFDGMLMEAYYLLPLKPGRVLITESAYNSLIAGIDQAAANAKAAAVAEASLRAAQLAAANQSLGTCLLGQGAPAEAVALLYGLPEGGD